MADYSDDITAGGVSQQMVPGNGARRSLWLQNISDTEMYLGFGTSAIAEAGFRLGVGGFLIIDGGDNRLRNQINVICAVINKKYIANDDSTSL